MKLMIDVPEEYYKWVQTIPDDALMMESLFIKHGKVVNVESVDRLKNMYEQLTKKLNDLANETV